MNKPQISVVISAKNEASNIEKCLQSLLEQKCKLPYEIILVDNNSTDNTLTLSRSLAKKYSTVGKAIRIFTEKKPGSPAARNMGAKKAKGTILVFTDADCTFHPKWLEKITLPFRKKYPHQLPVGGVSGKTVSAFQNPKKPNLWERYLDQWFLSCEEERTSEFPEFLPWAPTCNLAIRKDLFKTLGGFEENWKTAAYDVDLCWRLILCGFHLAYEPTAIIHHQRRNTLRDFLKQVESYAYYNQAMLREYKHFYKKQPVNFIFEKTKKIRKITNWDTLSMESINTLMQTTKSQAILRAKHFCPKGSKELDISRKGGGLESAIPAPYNNLHKVGWSYWKTPAKMNEKESSLILFHRRKKIWYKMNPTAWRIWESKASKNSTEKTAKILGQNPKNKNILDDIDLLTLEFKRNHLL